MKYMLLTFFLLSCTTTDIINIEFTPEDFTKNEIGPDPVAVAGCKEPAVKNESDDPWNNTDQQALKTATKHCKDIYRHSPCLKTFTKRAVNAYHAVCGAK